ncbi:MAG: hypothetical protein KA403_04625 [Candidatus Omnitrophica bacterium]|nr:hypothetical protein [Candidatus Omnitrophota bacterium]
MKSLPQRVLVLILQMCLVLFSASTVQAADDDKLMFAIKVTGGKCVYGLCHSEQYFFKDGVFKFSDGGGYQREGTLFADDLQKIAAAIEKTDFKVVKSKPFTQICRKAYDGSESVYYFYTSHGVEEIGTCAYVIDDQHPLFIEITNLLGRIMQ